MVIISFQSYMLYMYNMYDFPDVINMLCVTLLMCVFYLLLCGSCPFFYSKRERMCVAEDGAQKGFPALETSAF